MSINFKLSNKYQKLIFTFVLPFYTFNLLPLKEEYGSGAYWTALITAVVLIVAYNFLFIKQLSEFLVNKHSSAEIIGEFGIIVLIGIFNIILFAGIYFSFGVVEGVNPDNSPLISQGSYINSIYFSIVTWTTLGYGDFKPLEDLRLIAALQAFIGYVYMALLVGIFLNFSKIEIDKK